MAKVKGAALLDTVRFLRRHKDAARAQLAPALHHYLNERVLVASWYPEEDLVPLVLAIARVVGEPALAFCEKAGRLSAKAHAQGVYKHLVAGERESLARRTLALWTSQHDTGVMEMQGSVSGELRVVLRDFATPSREFCAINGGYVAATFEISGCRDVRVEKQSCCVDGAPECVWRVRWAQG